MKNLVKMLSLISLLVLSACGGLEDSVDISDRTVSKLADGYEITANVDCVGGGFLSSDKCEGAEVCLIAALQNAESEILESKESCKALNDVDDKNLYVITFPEDVAGAVKVDLSLNVKSDELWNYHNGETIDIEE